MRFLIASSVAVLLAYTPAFAQQATIFADSEAASSADAAPAPDAATAISLEGFNGGVSTTDAHDGGGGMMIQMLMPATGTAATTTPGPFVARPALTGGH